MPGRVLAGVLSLAVIIGALVGIILIRNGSPGSYPYQIGRPPAHSTASAEPAPGAGEGKGSKTRATVYLYYYLWWTAGHWRSKLGPAYPLEASPPPLPGRTNAAGCDPVATFPDATVVDLPSQGLYNQSDPSTFRPQIAAAEAAGVTGFLVSWQGTGTATQSATSSGYDQRLRLLVRAVDQYNRQHPTQPFHLGLALSAFGDYTRPASQIVSDLSYFTSTYGRDPAFQNQYSRKPIVILMDSRKFPQATVARVWASQHTRAYLVGDETAASWPRDAAYLDATSYYWSSENPVTNRAAGSDVRQLAQEVHGAGKLWFAPFIPGYDDQLVGGNCVPRNGLQTLRSVWQVNAASHPDAWFGISWNEFVENTYLEPSQAYGSTYLDELHRLIHGG
ncbi:MAG: hypothetical protein ACREOA_03815 [Candidatus Dormibacteria bacterium]